MASTRTPSARSRPAVRRPASPPAVDASDALSAILGRLADMGDATDEVDTEIRQWAASMLRDGESTGGSDATSRRIVGASAEAN